MRIIPVMEYLSRLLSRLDHPGVRSLAWSVFSPPIFTELNGYKHAHFELTDARHQWLLDLNRQPKALNTFMEEHCRSKRLGIVFERLWQFFISADPQTELIASNLAVYEQARTLGEFDLIYFCHRRNTPIHLELAVKFYLYTPHQNNHPFSCWLGPDSRDRLDIKVERLLQHQLPLAHTPQGRSALASLGVTEFEQELTIQGVLFYPQDAESRASSFQSSRSIQAEQTADQDSEISSHHQRGIHYPLNTAPKASNWLCLEKPEWLAATPHELGWAKRNYTEQTAEIARSQRTMMFIESESTEPQRRVFITADSWPHQHQDK